jgi:hypothetical protein
MAGLYWPRSMGPRSRLGLGAPVVQVALLGLLLVVSYAHPQWDPAAFGGVVPVPGPAARWLGRVLFPVAVALLAWNATRCRAALDREASRVSLGSVLALGCAMTALSVAIFPFLSHDLELYHAHGRMLAEAGANPYTLTPARVLRGALRQGIPWANQPAPYGPLPLALQALVAGGTTDGWAAALRLKALYAAPTLLFAAMLAAWRTAPPAARAAAVVGVTWPPIVLLELGGMGHVDGLLGVTSAAALWWIGRGRVWPGILLLGLASLVKLEALLFVPLAAASVASRGRPSADAAAPWRKTASAALVPLVVLAVLLVAYLPLGGLPVGLRAVQGEADKVLRSVPQAIAYVTGVPGAVVVRVFRVLLAVVLIALCRHAYRTGTVLGPATIAYAAYLCLGKGFLQPWHLVPLVHLSVTAGLVERMPALIDRTIALAGASALVGGYSYLFLAGSLAPIHQAVSTALMLGPPLALLAVGLVRAPRSAVAA